ncbi:hypothetical protein ACJ41O_009987 [Fusarium nematophilum]
MSFEQSAVSTTSDRLPKPTQGADLPRISVDVLDGDHRELFTRAISRVLATDIAEVSYAQILDGLPLRGVICDTADGLPPDSHPIYHVHEELCPSAIKKTREFRDSFDLQILEFNSRLLFAYKAAAPGSRAFKTHRIELVAVAVHQIAVILFKLDISLHKSDGITDWAPPETRSPLPIVGDDRNRNRVDTEEPIEATGIYRDRWERRERPPALSDERLRDVWDDLDFPTQTDKSAANQHARDQRNRFNNIDE